MTKEEKEQINRRAVKAANRVHAYQKVFTSPEGERVLHDMMKAHGMLQSHPANPQEMALKEGERLVILRILALLKTDPKKLLERIEDAQLDE